MPKDNENIRLPFVGPITPSESQGFTPDQMIRCDECLRANPPTRATCLYCATALPSTIETEKLRKPALRPPEKHLPGYNTIFIPGTSKPDTQAIESAAGLLKLQPDDLRRLVSAPSPLPIARTATREDADLVRARLSDIGLKPVVTLEDAELGLTEKEISRVRSLSFEDGQVTIFQSGFNEQKRFNWSDARLIVSGRLMQRTVELTERKSRRSEDEIVNSSEFFTDEMVLDLYFEGTSQTFRMSANGFDFSCLQEQMALTTHENMDQLVSLLRGKCLSAQFDESYNAFRQVLEAVWPLDHETLSRGWRRERPGRVSVGATSIHSNENQFSRFSRLRFYFCKRQV